MIAYSSQTYYIKDESSFNLALSSLRSQCREIPVSEIVLSKILTVASELGRNIIKYARFGEMKCELEHKADCSVFHIAVSDRGPGIEDLEKAMNDQFSTGGTLGLGLPGVKRLCYKFSIDSKVGQGTNVKAVVQL